MATNITETEDATAATASSQDDSNDKKTNLTKETEISENASTTTLSASNENVIAVSSIEDSILTKDASAPPSAAQDDDVVLIDLLSENIDSVFTEDKDDFTMKELKEFLKRLKESVMKEKDAKNAVEWIIAEFQIMNEENTYKTRIFRYLNNIQAKVNAYEDFGPEHKALLDELESFLYNLNLVGANQFSLDQKNKIYLVLLIIRERIRSQTKRLKSVKSVCQKFCDDFSRSGFPTSFILKYSASRNSAQLGIMADVVVRKKTVITTMKGFISNILDYEFLTTKIKNGVKKYLSSLFPTNDGKAELIITKLKDTAQDFLKSAEMEMNIEKGSEFMNTALQLVYDKGSYGTKTEKEIVNILNNIGEMIKFHEDFGLKFKDILVRVEIVIHLLLWERPDQFSYKIHKKIHFYLVCIQESIWLQTQRLRSIASNCDIFVSDFTKIVLPSISSHLDITAICERQRKFIANISIFTDNLENFDFLLSIILEIPLRESDSPLLTAEVDYIIKKLKEILKGFGRSVKKEIDSKNTTESLIAENDGRNEDFCREFKDILNELESVMDFIIVENDKFSTDNLNKIYSPLLIVNEGIQVLIVRLKLTKSKSEKLMNDFGKIGTDSSHLDNAVNALERKTEFIIELTDFIRILSRYDWFTSSILNMLAKNNASLSPASEDKADLIISELNEIVEMLEKSAKKERDYLKISRSMNAVLESVKDTETCRKQKVSISNDIKDKIKLQEEFCLHFKRILIMINSVMDNLIFEKIREFSLENQKKIYLYLLDVSETIEYHIDRLNSIKLNCEKFRSYYDKTEFPIIFSQSDITFDVTERQMMFITAVSVFSCNLSDYNLLASIILDILGKNVNSTSLIYEDKAVSIFKKLQNIVKQCNESVLNEIDTRNATKSFSAEVQSTKEKTTNKTKIINFLDDIKPKVKEHEDFCCEFKTFLEEIESVFDNLKFQKIDRFSIKHQKNIYFILRIARAGIRIQIDGLVSIKSKRKTSRNDCDKTGFGENSSYLDVAIDVSEKPTTFITAISEFIEVLLEQDSLASNILNSLEEKFAPPLAETEIKSEIIIKNIKHIIVELNELTKDEMEVRRVCESFNADTQLIAKGTKKKKIVKFLHDIQGKVKILDDFYCKIKKFVDDVEYVMNDLKSGEIYQFSHENQRYIYFYLLIVHGKIRFLIKTFNSIKSSIAKFCKDFCKLNFPAKVRRVVVAADVSERGKVFLTGIKSLIKYLSDYETSTSLILKSLKENLETNMNVPSSVIDKDSSESLNDKFQSFKEAESYESETVQFLNHIERKFGMCEELVRECKIFLDFLKPELDYVKFNETGHFPLARKKRIYRNLLMLRRDIISKIKWLNIIKPNVEKFQRQIGEAQFFKSSQHLDSMINFSNKLIPFIIAITIFIEDLEDYKDLASTIINDLKEEIKSEDKVPSPTV